MVTSLACEPTEEDKAYKGWKHLIPFRKASKNPKTLPLISAGPLNFGSVHWASSLVYRAYRYGLTVDDLYDTPWKDSSEYNSKIFGELWSRELSKHGKEQASVTRVIFKMVGSRILCSIFLTLLLNTFSFIGSAYFLRELLILIHAPDPEYLKQAVCVICIAFCTCMLTLCMSAGYGVAFTAGVRVRGGLLSFLFQEIVYQHTQTKSAGELINLCSNDGQRLFEAIANAPPVFGGLVALGAAVYAMYLLGPWGVFGFVIYFIFLPVQIWISKLIYDFRGLSIPLTEERVKLISEIITAIKLIKMYAWEKSFAKKVLDIRHQEKEVIQSSQTMQSLFAALPQIVLIFSAAFTFLGMTLTGYDITVTQAFVYISVLNSLRFTLTALPFGLTSIAEGLSSCRRIQEVLKMGERKPEATTSIRLKNDSVIEVRNGFFKWTSIPKINCEGVGGTKEKKRTSAGTSSNPEKLPLIDEKEKESRRSQATVVPTLHDISLSIETGRLLGVCGAIGSGKSSLLQAMIHNMEQTGGSLAIDETKKVAYVSQQAWIMNASIRQNIIFGQEYCEKWYNQVVEACALLSDFEQLPAGDQTEIGERGINLSGGQKQRVSIARAVYSDSDLILLDDPLSAVDALVGQHIFTNCLKGLLQNKTVVFVTHQLQFLTRCDYILVMKDGRISEEGTHETLMRDVGGEYCDLIRTFHNVNSGCQKRAPALDTDETLERMSKSLDLVGSGEGSKDRVTEEPPNLYLNSPQLKTIDSRKESSNCEELDRNDTKSQTDGKLTRAEVLKVDGVKFSVFKAYLSAGGGFCALWAVLLFIVMSLVTQAFTNYWLSIWLKAGSGELCINQSLANESHLVAGQCDGIIHNPRLHFYQIVYGLSLMFILLTTIGNGVTYINFCLKASTKLHDQMFRKILGSPMKFFDVTPSGQIINRMSKDLDELDNMLIICSDQFFKTGGVVLISVAIIISIFPYFILVLIPLVVTLLCIYKICKKGIILTRRIDNVTRSPLFSHIATTIQGISTISTYKKQEEFIQKFNHLQDTNNMAIFLCGSAMRWTSVRMDSTCLVIFIATYLCITLISTNSLSHSLAALALSSSINIGDLFQFAVRLAISVEARFTSVERISNYIEDSEMEAPAVIEHNRPKDIWPEEGAIKFDNVDVRYREGLPLVLKSISLDIKPQEKIGIVGRTGSGKSSLGMVLFRMMELAGGNITIDNVDISTIGLEDLRSKLSIIPQDPVLFVGTVRYNLDPFGVYRDEELWSALKKCHVKHTITALDGQLDAFVVENGENFSVGERQLLCMARALLRHSKVLVLDEATASIDTETDSLIQDTIKESFADCTMLTIAHRLNTVSNYDRILVLDGGKVQEFDTPAALLANQHSLFSQMMFNQ